MRIVVDGDACPTKDIIESIASQYSIEVIMIFDTAHQYESDYSTVIIVDKGSDSVDKKIIEIIKNGDIIVTQDYGLASLVLSKGARALNQYGLIYDNSNIDSLLHQRYLSANLRKHRHRTANQKKRVALDDINFEKSLKSMVDT